MLVLDGKRGVPVSRLEITVYSPGLAPGLQPRHPAVIVVAGIAHAYYPPLTSSCTVSRAASASDVQTDVDRYAEYPKLRDLVAAKDAQVQMFATPPYFMKV